MVFSLGIIGVGAKQIASGMDRFLVSDTIITLAGLVEDTILPSTGFDHLTIYLIWHNDGTSSRCPFRFEKLWLIHPNFLNTLQNWWFDLQVIGRSKMYIFQQKLKILKAHLKKWNMDTFRNIFHTKSHLEK